MASSRLILRSSRAVLTLSRSSARSFSVYSARSNNTDFSALNARCQDTADDYRRFQIEKPLNPHFTNTNSTIANEMPSLGSDAPPPELIKNVDGNFAPKDAVPENTERMTGGTQSSQSNDVSGSSANLAGNVEGELGVGELEGATFKVEPLRRTGEDEATMRARLLYQSRKRGTLESELLMSTFADANLATMTPSQLQQYDLFLDENDWDIYYWATQEPSPTSLETAEGSGSDLATPPAQGKDEYRRAPASGEWAQTVGTFKPAYRPVPQRWKDSEILNLLRAHVERRSAGEGKDDAKGLGKMPEIKVFDN
ncbi:TPR repeat protein-like protein [Massarina eburnea CBS 473.64]|uniref:Succinate dehydrogenase assembly factor 2, mitochondrial n=1 Tax=Massarina eburnea CBS 473.64 TaxID=1395130 RepID=A0A6A6RKW6_9PLEO|nr:TPR repeat protein-like protein [Massarina eburnea CBS 473.64]